MDKQGNIVKEYMDGNTTIKICDDSYINSTQEMIDLILKNCTRIASASVQKDIDNEEQSA